ncbi:MAG TPA: L,D-transpeptidase family protein [Candidatus Xenobia bacterium]|jgi:hypothetical protein
MSAWRLAGLGLTLIAVVSISLQRSMPQLASTPVVVGPPSVVHAPVADLQLSAAVVDHWHVHLSWQMPADWHPSAMTLYRSTTDLREGKLDVVHTPVTVLPQQVGSADVVDDTVPDNATLYYQLGVRQSKLAFSNVVRVKVPNVPLPPLQHPLLWIDKLHYTLEVREGDTPVKRYPLALGKNPVGRKLHQDNSTTPEGFYRICGRQPEAQFYRAFDVDYPNGLDKIRYDFAGQHGLLGADGPDIGGEIQIHGQSIHHNWTFGCMAMRQLDIDELFDHPEIGVGTPIVIVGSELTADDVAAIRSGPTDAQWSAIEQRLPTMDRDHLDARIVLKYQFEHHLPLTGALDTRTLRSITEVAQ